MGILVLNGSPKTDASNTMKLTNAFIEGLGRSDVEIIEIAKAEIKPCKGCYVCWEKTPGKCCINDDMQNLFQKYLDAELIIWSFPLYYFGVPSQMKAFMDRRLPVNLPYIIERADGRAAHPQRFDLSSQRHILISTCGFFTTENNYDALIKQFDIIFANNYEKILCPQGELFSIPQLTERTNEYLVLVKQAGSEYLLQGQFSVETKQKLSELLFPKEAFMEMANAHWQISETEDTTSISTQPSPCERLLRQMSAIYSPSANAPEEEKTIEFFFTDTSETYQLQVKNNKSLFVKEIAEYKPYSIRIETPFEVWLDISKGNLDGKQALFQNKYRVLGEFGLMLTLMEGFSVRTKQEKSSQKKRSMLVLLLPFLALWILLPVFDNFGAYTAIFINACIPFLTKFYKLSPYDKVSSFICSVLSIAFLIGVPSSIIVTLSYLLFGGMWLVSLFCRIPLCAWYSANNYNGDEAFDNPLFITTNRIIAFFWGILYLGVSVFTWFVMQSIYASLAGLFNSIAPAIVGIFTAFFIKWYPAHYARRKK